jgi:hypothetical protein
MGSWVIHALFVNDQGVGERADFQQPVPVAARTSQTRHLQAEDGTNMPQPYFGHHPLEAISTDSRRARLSLILVHHLDARRRPSQILCALDQVILSHLASRVCSHLEQGRLSDVDDSEPVKMVRTDFEGQLLGQHGRAPFQRHRQEDEPRLHLLLIEPVDQSHEFADRQRGQAIPGLVSPAEQQMRGARTCTNLLAEHRAHETQMLVSYLLCSWKWPLLLNELSDLPQSFNREHGWLCEAGISLRPSQIVGQTCGNRSMIAVGHTDDEVRVRSSPDANDLHALAVQGMMWMGYRHPFHRWLVKGGSVL